MTYALVTGQFAKTQVNSLSSASVVLPNNPTAGNLVVVTFQVGVASGAFSCQDSAATPNVYTATSKTPFFNATASLGVGIFYLIATATATKTITVTFPTTLFGDLFAAEFSGGATTSVFENDATAAQTTVTTVNLPSYTSVNDGDLLIGAVAVTSTTSSANTPWTNWPAGIGANGDASEYLIQTTHGAQAVAFTITSGSTAGMIAAFKAAASAAQNPFINFFNTVDPVLARADPITNRTHISTLLPDLRGQDKFFGLAGHPNYDWPNPGHFALRPDPITNKTHIATMLPDLAGKDKFFGLAGHPNYDWPNPGHFALRPDPITNKTHIATMLPDLAGKDQFFGLAGHPNYDWPNVPAPAPRQSFVDYLTFLLRPPEPAQRYDLPNPTPALGARQDWIWTATQFIPVTVTVNPFYQTDWQNPVGPLSRADWIWAWTATAVTLSGPVRVSRTPSATSFSATNSVQFAITLNAGDTAFIVYLVLNGSPIVSATWDQGNTNQAMTLIGQQSFPTPSNGCVYAFGLLNPAPGHLILQLNYTGTFSGVIGFQSYVGNTTTSFGNCFALGSLANGTTASTSQTVNVTSVAYGAGDMDIGAFGFNNAGGQALFDTQIYSTSFSTTLTGGAEYFSALGAGLHTSNDSITQSGSQWAGIGFTILANGNSVANPEIVSLYDSPPRSRPDLITNLSHLATLIPVLFSAGAKPFLWQDWPNTPGPLPRPDFIQPASNPAFLNTGTKPFLWQDWPSAPAPSPRQDYIDPAASFPPFLLTGTKPFLWNDWPSAPPPQPRQSWLWSETAYIPVTVTQNPFAQYNWPSPPGLGARADWVWPASNPIFLNTGTKPFLWQDWPSAPAVSYRDVGWIWTETAFIPVVTVTRPFSQIDWPNPGQPRDVSQYQTFTDHLSIELTPPEGAQRSIWPNPYQSRAYFDVAWFWNTTVYFPTAAVQAPFAQYDWPNPRALGARSDWIWDASNPAFLNTGAKPFLWQDWPTASPAVTYRDLGWIWNETAFIPVTVTVSPFYQTDWPVPSRVAYRDVGSVAGYEPRYLNTGTKPFTQGDWPNPRAALQPLQGIVNAYNTFYVFTPVVTTGVHFNPFLASVGRMKTIS